MTHTHVSFGSLLACVCVMLTQFIEALAELAAAAMLYVYI